MSRPDPSPSDAALAATLAARLATLPDAPGVYLHKNRQGRVIYVGKASRLAQRVRSYFQPGADHGPRIALLVRQIADFDVIVTASDVEALVLEAQLIREYRPLYNIRLKDDKAFPWVRVSVQEPFPRLSVVRRLAADGARYFGPYTDARALRETLKFAAGAFQVRTCTLDLPEHTVPRPCLEYQIGRCSAPCVGYDARDTYRRRVRQLVLFLEGADRSLLADLRREMAAHAAAHRFEAAAAVRDRLQKVERTVDATQAVAGLGDALDVCALVRDGGAACGVVLRVRGGKVLTTHRFLLTDRLASGPEDFLAQLLREYYDRAGEIPAEVLVSHPLPDRAEWEQWLTTRRGRRVALRRPVRGAKRAVMTLALANAAHQLEREARLGAEAGHHAKRIAAPAVRLQEALGLRAVPELIVCFDISNLQGREAVGSLVTFRGGEPLKSRYRRFRIRTVTGSDDYAMMREVLTRHFGRLAAAAERPPDLVMVDGGAGQLGVAREVLDVHGFSATEAIGLAKQEEIVHRDGGRPPVALSGRDPSRLYLQRIRDEAHRFAIAYHRLLRDRRTEASLLDAIPGIGRARKLALLHHFGSVEAVRAAGAAELAAVRGLSPADAERILAWFAARDGR
ncbi:MAG: excinuclease ABC subunit UvrC [Candidatus Krumholzibacteriia bacterium]